MTEEGRKSPSPRPPFLLQLSVIYGELALGENRKGKASLTSLFSILQVDMRREKGFALSLVERGSYGVGKERHERPSKASLPFALICRGPPA